MRLYGNTSAPSNRAVPLIPTLSLLLGATLWGVIWYPMRLLESGGLDGVWLTLILYAAALVVSLPRTAGAFREFPSFPRGVVLLALAGGWTNVAFVLAILDGNVMRVLLLFYLSPVWAVLFARLFLGERFTRLAIASLAVALVGAGTMLWDPALGMPWPQDRTDWLAISAGFAFGVNNVIVRGLPDLSMAGKAASVWLGVVLLALSLIAMMNLPPPPVGLGVVGGAIALGAAAIVAMTLLVQYGVTHLPIHRSAVILLFELVAGALSQQLLTDEVMTLKEWIGGALIVAAGYVAARY